MKSVCVPGSGYNRIADGECPGFKGSKAIDGISTGHQNKCNARALCLVYLTENMLCEGKQRERPAASRAQVIV